MNIRVIKFILEWTALYTCVMLCGKWHFVACLISVEEKKTACIITKDSSYNVLHSCTKNHCWSAVIGIKA